MDEAKILQFNNSDEGLLDLAEARRKSGNLDGALSTLFYLQERGVRLIDLYAEIALCFMELGLNTHAVKYWFKYMAYAPKAKLGRVYNALGACFYYLGNYGMSGYYFEKQLSIDTDREYEFDHIMMDYYDSVCEMTKPDFYICYPPKMVKTDIILDEAERLFDERRFSDAIDKFSQIPENDDSFSDAQLRISACYLYQGKFDLAVLTVKELIEKDETNKKAIINMLGLLATIGKREDIDKYLEMAEKLEFTSADECYKLATVYCDAKNDEKAKFYLEKAVSDDYYDINANFLLAMVYYNLKDFASSRKKFSLCYRLTKSVIAKYYLKLLDKVENGGEFKPIYYVFNVQKEEEKKNNDLIKAIIKNGKKTLKSTDKNDVLDLLDWSLAIESDLIEPLASSILEVGGVVYRKYFIDKLLDPFVSDDLKSLVISKLVEKGYDKKVGLTFGAFFTRLQLLKAEFDKEKNELFTRAYALAFGKIAPIEPDFGYKIRDGAYKLYYELKENGNLRKISDLNALAGAIAIYSGQKLSKKRSLIANYFYTQPVDIKRVIDLAKEQK